MRTIRNAKITNYICKSRVKKEFRLTDTQIESLKCIEVTNPHYKCAANMKLYRIFDVHFLASIVYDGMQNVEKIRERKRK